MDLVRVIDHRQRRRSWQIFLISHPEFVEFCSLDFNNPLLRTIPTILLGSPLPQRNSRLIHFEAVSSLLEVLNSISLAVTLTRPHHLRNPTFLPSKTAAGIVSTNSVPQFRSSEYFYQHSEMPQAPLASMDHCFHCFDKS